MMRSYTYKIWITTGFLILLQGSLVSSYSQNQRKMDSLTDVIRKAEHDTTIANAYVLISEIYFTSKPDTVFHLCKKALNLISKNNHVGHEIAFRNIKAKAMNNIGTLWMLKGSFEKALAYIDSSKILYEQADNKEGMGLALFNVSHILKSQGDTSKAIGYINKALVLFREINDQLKISHCLNSLGFINMERGNIPKALTFFKECLKIRENLNDQKNLAVVYNNIGFLYRKQNSMDTALYYLNRASEIYKETDYQRGIVVSKINIGDIHYKKGNIDLAFEHGINSLLLAQELGFPALISSGAGLLSKIYEHKNDHSKALEHFELYLQMQDSLQSKEIQKKISNQEKKLSLSGKENERKVLEKENQIKEVLVQHQKEKSRKQKLIMGLAVGVIMLLVLLSYLAYRGYILKKRANLLINTKNKTIEDQQEQITESIEYARNLQRTIMVTEECICNDLTDCLLINKPRNIVSGDFHWYKKIQDRVFIAMIDCTGHGVPGALTSIIGNNQMHNIINENPLLSPGEILSKLHSKIIKALKVEKDSTEVNTGMEMALCIIDKKNNLLTYAGANMPLFVLRDDHIEEIEPTKQGIGYSAFFRKALENIEFVNNTIKLEDDTSFYMVTDGIIDQFDHNNKNKYGKQLLLDLLIKTGKQNMASQKQNIISDINIWKGETPQTDDVSLVGFRI